MFRIRVRIDPERLEGREALVRSGLPGVAYVAHRSVRRLAGQVCSRARRRRERCR